MREIVFLLIAFSSAYATAEPLCPGGSAVANFRLQVERPGEKGVQPIEDLNALRKGDTVIYVPGDPAPGDDLDKADVVLLIAPKEGQELQVMERKPALGRQRWELKFDASVVALAYGPAGLRADRVQNMVKKDPELVAQLAEYGERTTQVETLVSAMSRPAADAQTMEAALRGFASSGAGGARLDRNATLDQQTLTMMRALNPALAAYDPLSPEPRVRWQQSAGLAAAVAGLFFGNTVAVAATSATLFLNLRSVAFPRTEFRSALRRDSSLCAKRESGSGVRFAYLWARRFPESRQPDLALREPLHLGAGLPAKIEFATPAGAWGQVRKWRWVDAEGNSQAAEGSVNGGALQLAKPPAPGTYRLAGDWDWQELQAAQPVTVYALPDLTAVRLTEASADALEAGRGRVRLRLTGVDFQFVTKVELESVADALAEKVAARFVPVKGPAPELEMEVDTDRLRQGAHRLWLTRADGEVHAFAAMVHGPAPRLTGGPSMVRQDGTAQRIRLTGERLEEVERLEFAGGTVQWLRELREAEVRLNPQTLPGTSWELTAWVGGRNLPVKWPDGIRVLPPAVRVVSVQRAARTAGSVELLDSEVDAGVAVSLAVKLSGPLAEAPKVARCGQLERADRLSESEWFIVLRPEGADGCRVSVEVEPGGAEIAVGKLVRRPDLTGFTLSGEAAGENQYWGELTGSGLERIVRVGWNEREGIPVTELPAGESGRQKLRLAVPWPAPAPRAPLYIWLRGETAGRRTNARF